MEEDCVAVIRRLEDKDGEQYSHVFAEVLTNAVQRELKKGFVHPTERWLLLFERGIPFL